MCQCADCIVRELRAEVEHLREQLEKLEKYRHAPGKLIIPRLLNLRFVLFFLDFCFFHFLLMVAIGGMTDELARAEIEAKINSSTSTFPNN